MNKAEREALIEKLPDDCGDYCDGHPLCCKKHAKLAGPSKETEK